jgi:hypothetical protein
MSIGSDRKWKDGKTERRKEGKKEMMEMMEMKEIKEMMGVWRIVVLALLIVGTTVQAEQGGPRHMFIDERGDAPAEDGDPVLLPAGWIGLAGVRSADGTLLRWSTASESNSAWFKIEWRVAGENDWRVVDIMQGAGESRSPRFYSWHHAQTPPGALEYRLRQIDGYGNVISTGTLRIERAAAGNVSLAPCFPNPANGETLSAISSGSAVIATLVITDLAGRIKQIVFQDQDLLPGSYRFRIETATLPVGSYILRLTTSDGVASQRLMIAR